LSLTATTPATIARRLDRAEIILRRWAGCWIDFITLGILLAGPFLVLALARLDTAAQLALVVSSLLVLAYFPVTEGLWGRSLGKLVTGLVVVDQHGGRPGLAKAALRTLARLIEVNPFLLGGIPAGLIVVFSKERQRLGDMWAGTYVIPLKALKLADQEAAAVFA
jgi:uncharacterized RDD family membrane protein YckC